MSTLVRSTTIFWDLGMLLASVSTGIVLFPSHMGGEKSTQPGNEDNMSKEISDDTFLNCQGLWLECLFFVVALYTL